MNDKMTRREFLTAAGAAALAAVGAGCAGKARKASAAAIRFGSPKGIENKLVVASGTDIEAGILSALKKLGGIGKFVRPGDKVVLKPNGAWAREPGQGATTNPDVLRVVALMCKKAGASEVIIVEHTIDRPAAMVLAMSGISEAARKAGAKLISAGDESMYGEIAVPKGVILRKDQVARAVLDADVFITLPVLKTHATTVFTGTLKNQFGCYPQHNRILLHPKLDHVIVHINRVLKPRLAIMDAIVGMEGRGPINGKPRELGVVLGSTDPVALDATAMRLVGLDPGESGHIKLAAEQGLGSIEPDDIAIDGPFEECRTQFEPAEKDLPIKMLALISRSRFLTEKLILNPESFYPLRSAAMVFRQVRDFGLGVLGGRKSS